MNSVTQHSPLRVTDLTLSRPHGKAKTPARWGLRARAWRWLLPAALGLLLAILPRATVSVSLACELPQPSYWTPGGAPTFTIADLILESDITGLKIYKPYYWFYQNISQFGTFRSYVSDQDDFYSWNNGAYQCSSVNDPYWDSVLEDIDIPYPGTYPIVFDWSNNEYYDRLAAKDPDATVRAKVTLLQVDIGGETLPPFLALGETRKLVASISPYVPGGPFEWSVPYSNGLCFVVDGQEQSTATGPSVVIKARAASQYIGDQIVCLSYAAGPDDLGRTVTIDTELGFTAYTAVLSVRRSDSWEDFGPTADVAAGGLAPSVHWADVLVSTYPPAPGVTLTVAIRDGEGLGKYCPATLSPTYYTTGEDGTASADYAYLSSDKLEDVTVDVYKVPEQVMDSAIVYQLWDDEAGPNLVVEDFFVPGDPGPCSFHCQLDPWSPITGHTMVFYTQDLTLSLTILDPDTGEVIDDYAQTFYDPFADLAPYGLSIDDFVARDAVSETDPGTYSSTQTYYDYSGTVVIDGVQVWLSAEPASYTLGVYDAGVYDCP